MGIGQSHDLEQEMQHQGECDNRCRGDARDLVEQGWKILLIHTERQREVNQPLMSSG